MTTKTVGKPRNIDEQTRRAKNGKIRASIAETRSRRENQVKRTVDLKVVANKLNRKQKEALRRVFLEAKWIRNDCLAHGIDGYEPGTTATVKLPDGTFEERELTVIGSQMKQSVVSQLKSDRTSLSSSKKRGRKVGKLKFKSKVGSIDLKQYGTTYAFKEKNNKRVHVQNVPGYVRIRGTDQIGENVAEFANAKLVQRADGYHIIVTCCYWKDDIADEYQPGTLVGIDMGLKTAITLSDETEIEASVGETERLKKLQKRKAKTKKGSSNRRRIQDEIDKQYLKMTYRKDDMANKAVHLILKNETVFMQDENIKGWKAKKGYVRGGRTVQKSILGRVKTKLKAHPRVVVLPRHVATTATCPVCKHKTEHLPYKRTFECESCHHTAPRDRHGACNMVRLGAPYVPAERGCLRAEALSDLTDEAISALAAKH